MDHHSSRVGVASGSDSYRSQPDRNAGCSRRTMNGRKPDSHMMCRATDGVSTGMLNPLNILNRTTTTCYSAMVGDSVIAESSATRGVEGNRYFPPDSVNWELLEPSEKTTVCHWKGVANYFDVVVDGDRLPAAAWTYKTPSSAAEHIKDHVAFWRGVKVVKS